MNERQGRMKIMATAVFEKNGTTLNVQLLADRLDSLHAPQLEQELKPYVNDTQLIVMDFSGVVYVCSAAFRVLMWLEQTLEQRGGEVQVIRASESVLKIFELVGFMNVVHVIRD